MRTLFFVDDLPTTVGQIYEFNNDDANHAVRVLRISTGDLFNLSDGQGRWSLVSVVSVTKKSAQVKVVETGLEDALPALYGYSSYPERRSCKRDD